MRYCAIAACMVLGLPSFPVVYAQQHADETIKILLEKAYNAPKSEKLVFLQKIVKLLPKRKRLEDSKLTRSFAELLSNATTTPKEVRKLLGAPALIVRQIIYRRFREQWHYDAPLRLLIVVETRQGKAAAILTVQPHLRTKP